MRHALARIALVLLAAAGVACSDDPGPIADESGVYVLRTVGDSTLPLAQYTVGGYESVLLADTLALDGRGTYTGTAVYRVTEPGQPPTVSRLVLQDRYTRRGNILSLAFRCPPNALCARPLVGYILVPSGIHTYSLDPQFPQPVSFFERVP